MKNKTIPSELAIIDDEIFVMNDGRIIFTPKELRRFMKAMIKKGKKQ